jgi:microcystin-dependent protein
MTKDELRETITEAVDHVLDAPILPPGWLWCRGQSLKIKEYSELYAVVRNHYTPPNPYRGTFTIPKLHNCSIKAKDTSTDGYTIGMTHQFYFTGPFDLNINLRSNGVWIQP